MISYMISVFFYEIILNIIKTNYKNPNNIILIQISGCLFHFNRAIDTNIAAKKLGELRKKSPRFGHAIRQIKALALTPKTRVQQGFQVVLDYLDKHAEVTTYCLTMIFI